MKVKIWDRKEPINGLAAEKFIEASKTWLHDNTVVIFGYEGDLSKTSTADDLRTVRQILTMPDAPEWEVVEAWEEYLNRPAPAPVDDTEQRLADIEAAISELAFGGEQA